MKNILLLVFVSMSLIANEKQRVEILDVSVSGNDGAYIFSVALQSPDVDCKQYTDWWEILDAKGKLLYRRILFHSHAHEQPFRRSGNPVAINTSQKIYIRAHMKPFGYAKRVFSGSVADGFKKDTNPIHFNNALEMMAPQPQSCWY